MAVIDVGSAATDRGSFFGATQTLIDLNNPANDTGILDVFEIWMSLTSGTGLVFGTFSGSGTDYTSRDSESIGNVTSGSKQTFTGKSCSVTTGDFIGLYAATGFTERDTSGYTAAASVTGNKFGAGLTTYTIATDDAISFYATGATAGGSTVFLPNIMKHNFIPPLIGGY